MITETCPICGKNHTFNVPTEADIDTPLFRCEKAWAKKVATWHFHNQIPNKYYLDVTLNRKYLPAKLKEMRKKSGLTQTELAEKIGEGFEKGFVSAVENGKRIIKQDLIERWASVCGYIASIEFHKI